MLMASLLNNNQLLIWVFRSLRAGTLYMEVISFGGALEKMNRGSAPPGSTGTEPSIFEFTDSALNPRYSQVFDGKLLGLDVLWVYSSADCSLDTGRELVRWSTSQKQFSDSQLQDISNIQLFEGWNFFYTPDF